MIGGQGATERFLADDAGRVHPVLAAALAPFAPPGSRAVAFGPTFAAWRVGERSQAYPLDPAGATLAEVVGNAAPSCFHKDTLIVRETDPLTRETTVHHFAIKRESKGRWVTRNHVPTKVHDLYADPLFAMRVDAFEPTRPFDALRDEATGYAHLERVVS